MKKYFILIALLISIFKLYAQSVQGRLNCNVTGSLVAASEEGKYKTYSKIKDGIGLNDKVILEYTARPKSIYIAMKSPQKDKDITITSEYIDFEDSPKNVETHINPDNGIVISKKSFNHSISFQSDYIRIKNFGELALVRYYKNDWHGIYTKMYPNESVTQVLAFNCRQVDDKIESALKIINPPNNN